MNYFFLKYDHIDWINPEKKNLGILIWLCVSLFR